MQPKDGFEPGIPVDALYRRVPPEQYHRRKNPSLKDLHDFLAWLRETTLVELERTSGDVAGMKGFFIGYFRRGLEAEVPLETLVENLGPVFVQLDCPIEKKKEVIEMVKALTLDQIQPKP